MESSGCVRLTGRRRCVRFPTMNRNELAVRPVCLTMTRLLPVFVAAVLFVGSRASAAEFDLSQALKKVEERYNIIRSLQLDFEQTLSYASQPKAARTETGTLFLRKPGKMRWEYKEPQKKLFVSDGKYIFYYSQSSNRVERALVKETDDMRTPLAFLIGRLDFYRDFKEFRHRPERGGQWVIAIPKSDKAPYKEVQFLVTDTFQITRLRVSGQDQSIMDFTFRNEKLNPPVDEKIFSFQPPAGAEFVDLTASSQR